MGELGDALVAMHGARHRHRSLRATIHEQHDGALARRAAERYAETAAAKQSGFAELIEEVRDDASAWPTSDGSWRLWFERPYRLREERDESLRGIALGIRDGRRWWMYDRRFGPHSNEDDVSVGSEVGEAARLLLDPSPLLGALRFEARGRSEIAGREAIVLHAKRRRGARHSPALDRLGDEVSGLELGVDAERGVLLRRRLLLEGRPYSATELVDVAFDETFPPDTFTFVLPEDETRRPGDWGKVREVGLAEAATLMRFPVFTLDLPDEWGHRASYQPGDERAGSPPVVSIDYRLSDASHRILATERETGSTDEFDERVKWERRDFRGEQVEVAPQRRPLMTWVRLDREGTTIMLGSDTLELDRLLQLTRALRRLPPA